MKMQIFKINQSRRIKVSMSQRDIKVFKTSLTQPHDSLNHVFRKLNKVSLNPVLLILETNISSMFRELKDSLEGARSNSGRTGGRYLG